MVLRERIAASGLEVSVLYFFIRAAGLYPSSSFMVMYEIGVLINVASSTEQRKEMSIALRRKTKSRVIKAGGSVFYCGELLAYLGFYFVAELGVAAEELLDRGKTLGQLFTAVAEP